MSRGKEDLERGILNEEAGVENRRVSPGSWDPIPVRDLATAGVVDSFLKSSFTDIHSK